MLRVGWFRVAVVVLIAAFSLGLPLWADDNSFAPAMDDYTRASLATADAKREAAEASGTIPAVIPFGVDPEHPEAVAAPGISIPRLPTSDYLDPNAPELERIEAMIRHRAETGEDKEPHCYYGPVNRRISPERLRQIAKDYGQTDAAWRELSAIDDDPNLPAVSVVVPAPGGPTCTRDVDKELQDRRNELLQGSAQ